MFDALGNVWRWLVKNFVWWLFTAIMAVSAFPSVIKYLISSLGLPSPDMASYRPDVAVLAATGMALVWYTKFTKDLKDEQRKLVLLETEGREATQKATLQTLLAELKWIKKWLNQRKDAEGPTLHHPLRKEALDLVLADGGRIKGLTPYLIEQLVELRIILHSLHDRNELLIQSRTGTLPLDVYKQYWEDVEVALGYVKTAMTVLSPPPPPDSAVVRISKWCAGLLSRKRTKRLSKSSFEEVKADQGAAEPV